MPENNLDLQKFGINLPKNTDSVELKKVIKKIAAINNQVADLIDDETNDAERLKVIKNEIKEKCKKILEEQKEIRNRKKAFSEKKLMLLGERNAYKKELKALGVSMRSEELATITTNAASKKILLTQEVEG